jgi:clan AA aspartic protease
MAMIIGSVNAAIEAEVPLTVISPGGRQQSILAIIDTGFTGYLTLPPQLIATLRSPFLRNSHVVLGDGSISSFNYYQGTIIWDGVRKRIPIAASDTVSLLGMDLLHGYRLTIDTISGGRVTIEGLPSP